MAALRAAPYRLKPTVALLNSIQRVIGDPTEDRPGLTMFLVANPSPSTWVVKEEGSDEARKVMLGVKMTCSCGGGLHTAAPAPPTMAASRDGLGTSSTLDQSAELCEHLLYVPSIECPPVARFSGASFFFFWPLMPL